MSNFNFYSKFSKAFLLSCILFASQIYSTSEEDFLRLARFKAARGGYQGERSDLFTGFVEKFERFDARIKSDIVQIYNDLKHKSGSDSAIATIATGLRDNGLERLLSAFPLAQPFFEIAARRNPYPAAAAHASAAAHPSAFLKQAPPQDEIMILANKFARESFERYREPSVIFTSFIGAFSSLNQDQKDNISRIYNKFTKEDGWNQKEAIITIAGECQDRDSAITFIAKHFGVAREDDNPEIRKLETEKAQILGRMGAGSKDAIDRVAYPHAYRQISEIEAKIRSERANPGVALARQQEEARHRQEEARQRQIVEAENERAARRLQAEEEARVYGYHQPVDAVARRLQEDEDAKLAQRLQNAHVGDEAFARRLQAEREARQGHQVFAPLPHEGRYEGRKAAAGAGGGVVMQPKAALPQPGVDIAIEEFKHNEGKIIEDAYLAVMRDLQRNGADRIKALENEIKNLEAALAAPGMYNIADVRARLTQANREKDALTKASNDAMNRYADAFDAAATPKAKAETEGVQILMQKIYEQGNAISYGKILGYLQAIMGW